MEEESAPQNQGGMDHEEDDFQVAPIPQKGFSGHNQIPQKKQHQPENAATPNRICYRKQGHVLRGLRMHKNPKHESTKNIARPSKQKPHGNKMIIIWDKYKLKTKEWRKEKGTSSSPRPEKVIALGIGAWLIWYVLSSVKSKYESWVGNVGKRKAIRRSPMTRWRNATARSLP